ncbi:hypothetical protein Cpap_4244 [Ruminiclostridium papyrosolvens DSM 2782]|uniref:Uncharacterized protein n=1 Tax=Ruminiclostridium papyrosolvens DSM 2782 TaxID=588581 RepID=F1T8K2_9FIRM|nr:hypothetical protein [Ruminiclostridium papyrosolvens]EGD49800.1 hypothetical protein Cpap_4244 [Ruminiclostridium papyrosolvens DSM 2782]WES33072.1 hypothetical protein P0092_15060 [Ruminiclostridium papyrosolvens DSM 2782]
MEPIYKLMYSALGVPMKSSGSQAAGTPVTVESDSSNSPEVTENLQNETSSDSFISDNAEKPEPDGTNSPSEDIIKSDASKNSNKEVSLKIDFSDNGLIQGFIMSEILAPPKAMKRRGNTLWNSRF